MSIGLIVSDVHESFTKLTNILKKYEKSVQWVVFLGDWFDSFDGFTWQTQETVKWLVANLSNPKYTFIWGNHDIHYAFPVNGTICSGFDRVKLKLINGNLNQDHWAKFKLLHWIGTPPPEDQLGNTTKPTEWLCSHAGIHPSLLHPIHGFQRKALEHMEGKAMWMLRYCQEVTPFIGIGQGRGGFAKVGGIDWLDWKTEFVPIPGLNQIVGHSFSKSVRTNHIENSYNYCIDTALTHVIFIEEDWSVKVERMQLTD